MGLLKNVLFSLALALFLIGIAVVVFPLLNVFEINNSLIIGLILIAGSILSLIFALVIKMFYGPKRFKSKYGLHMELE